MVGEFGLVNSGLVNSGLVNLVGELWNCGECMVQFLNQQAWNAWFGVDDCGRI